MTDMRGIIERALINNEANSVTDPLLISCCEEITRLRELILLRGFDPDTGEPLEFEPQQLWEGECHASHEEV